MKVSINSKVFDFVSGYNTHKPSENGWRKQNQDAFKLCTIGGVKVFVKRFEKPNNSIPGYQYLIKTKFKKLNNLPVIYDFVTQTEDNKNVSYLFLESLEGFTLEEIMHNSVFEFNPLKFVRNIYAALQSITSNGFWYTDFVEKNIFVCTNGDYYLIDLDSVVPLAILPNEDHPHISQVNKNYKIAVSTYWYRDSLNYPFAYISKYLNGDTINFLELFIFIAQFRYYLDKNQSVNFFDVNTRKAIPDYLLDKNNSLTYAVFRSCFENSSNHQQVLSLKLFESYLNNVLSFDDKTIKIDFQNKKIIGSNTGGAKSRKASTNSSNQLLLDSENEKKLIIERLVTVVNANIDQGLFPAAAKNIAKIHDLDSMNPVIAILNKKLEIKKKSNQSAIFSDERSRLQRAAIDPYKCSSCGYPIKKNESNTFNILMHFVPAAFLIMLFWQFFGVWSLVLIIICPYLWIGLSYFMPDHWVYKKLKCKNCNYEYFDTKEAY